MNNTALILIDIQNDYFSGGRMALPGAEAAGAKAQMLLDHFRKAGARIVHIRHESIRPGSTFFLPGTSGADIHELVTPLPCETVLTKNYPDSFQGTGLHDLLQAWQISDLVVTGMMTCMCVDTTIRRGFSQGYSQTLIADATATPPLEFSGVHVPAEQVQAAYLAAMGMVFAQIKTLADYLQFCQ